MIDLKLLRDSPEALDAGLARRGLPPLSSQLQSLDAQSRKARTRWETLQAERNTLSKQIGEAKKAGGDADALMARVAAIKTEMEAAEAEEKAAAEALDEQLSAIPNLPMDDVPNGRDETANVERFRHLDPVRLNNARDHVDIGTGLGMMDFDAAARLSGSRFVVLRKDLARLERALGQFMIDTHTTEHGYTEVNAPMLVGTAAMYGTAQLPKFRDDQFKIESSDLWLIPTAEVSLTNLAGDRILDEAELPLRMTSLTPCFRGEAGSAGRDTRGMIRQHQFWKCELVSITTPEQSEEEHERMLDCAQAILKKLGLPFRTVTLCSGDMGFAAAKTYDIEVWLPGQNTYREISSCSNTRDFQARRMKARFKGKDGKGTRPVHTLNGSGVAVGRALVAVLENYQQPDGSVRVPDVLKPYMGGLEVISK